MDMEPERLAKVFGENVKRRRSELRLTQADLSERTGIPRPDISDLEQGKRSPNLATIARISDGLAIPASHLLSAEPLAAV